MSKIEKQIASIRNNPTNVKFETLEKILLNLGFEIKQARSGSSHYTFRKDKYIIQSPNINQLIKFTSNNFFNCLMKLLKMKGR